MIGLRWRRKRTGEQGPKGGGGSKKRDNMEGAEEEDEDNEEEEVSVWQEKNEDNKV